MFDGALKGAAATDAHTLQSPSGGSGGHLVTGWPSGARRGPLPWTS